MPVPEDLERALTRDVKLRSGAVVHLRPIRPDDAPRLIALYDHLSRDTAYQRFFTVMRRLPPDWARFLATVDYRRRFALVAEAGDAVIAVGRYEPTAIEGVAEVAFVVQDAWQDQGLGTILFQDLLRAAGLNGIRHFQAWVLATNRRMLDLIARFGDVHARRTAGGVTEIAFTTRAAGA